MYCTHKLIRAGNKHMLFRARANLEKGRRYQRKQKISFLDMCLQIYVNLGFLKKRQETDIQLLLCFPSPVYFTGILETMQTLDVPRTRSKIYIVFTHAAWAHSISCRDFRCPLHPYSRTVYDNCIFIPQQFSLEQLNHEHCHDH